MTASNARTNGCDPNSLIRAGHSLGSDKPTFLLRGLLLEILWDDSPILKFPQPDHRRYHFVAGGRERAGGVLYPLCAVWVRESARDLMNDFIEYFGGSISFQQCGVKIIPQDLIDSLKFGFHDGTQQPIQLLLYSCTPNF